jgi:proteasome lid subunit RPN8/RPN11
MELTRENGVEYSGWILEDAPGQYSVSVLKEGEAMGVTPAPKPENAIGNFHTHTSESSSPSSYDEEFAAYSENKCIFYMIISAYGDYSYIDGNGESVFCDN